ncbi:MAG: hypothetical protein E7597_08225 [Ruminococcaceae bacterium]|nr:hypothetical protein [Oscillospiraceae bacterium]
MSFNFKKALCTLMLPVAVFALASCSAKDSQYEINNESGYTVSVKFDANGGSFGDSNTWVVSNCYNIKNLPENADGKVDIPLALPYEEKDQSFKVKKAGYDLLGWYEKRIEHKDKNGEVYYTYEGRWEFDAENYGKDTYSPDKLTVDPDKQYKSEEPVLTLYAAWIPKFEINFYDVSTNAIYSTKPINPAMGTEFTMPYWVEGEATMQLGDIPAKAGYTFKAAYVDGKNGRELLTGDSFLHSGSVNIDTGEVEGEASMNVYVEWDQEYRIYTPEQLNENYSPTAKYVLYNDLDFADSFWPDAFTTNTFSGSIDGNGHSISNVNIVYNGNSVSGFGLFGKLDETASLKDIKFDNISLTIAKGSRIPINYGVLAGTINSSAIENVEFTNSTLAIAYDISFLTQDYSIGLISGYGEHGVDYSGITCVATEGGEPKFSIELSNDTVLLDFDGGETTEESSVTENS